jgi:Fuc2NAc and GlcNAc transferase
MIFYGVCVIVFIAALLGTGLLRRYALARSLMDIPNARSSHSVPTPRGGGVAVVFCFLGALPVFLYMGLLEESLFWALLGSGGGIALLGFLDDHGHIAARWRLLGHFIAAGWVVFFLKGLPLILLFGAIYDFSYFGCILAAIYLVWMLNLYNFMDGVDGIASVEAISVCGGAALIYLLTDHAEHGYLLIVLAAAVAGFLFWNFPPAKIFMGDAGSGFLGITLACFSLQAGWIAAELLWCWLILLGVFIVDATWTLLRRLFHGEAVYEAHRSHTYQIASRRYGSHLSITLAVLLINLFWLFPWALAVAMGYIDAFIALLLAYAPLCWLAIRLGAGAPERAR